MTLSKALIGELQIILREEYGAEISETEAAEIGLNFVRYFDQLIKITHRAENKIPLSSGQHPPSKSEEGS
ncbi:MAG: hypothetical protein Q7R81_02820 [Candidatus Peregrinibacteria bacterium]|nr:hypothetical protein [Candidatus Peregrinibacteria bacterium]